MLFPLYDDNPTQRRPVVTWLLIAFNIFVWIIVQGAGLDESSLELSLAVLGLPPLDAFTDSFSVDFLWFLLFGFTSMFAHVSWAHLIGNMWFLWIFGNNVEDSMSGKKFLLLYIACGYAGCLLHLISNPASGLIGASGAVTGVSAAYLLLYPKCKIYTALVIIRFIWIFRAPAFLLVGTHGALDMLRAYSDIGAGVSHWAHIGGLIAGISLVKLLVDSERLSLQPFHGWNPKRIDPPELSDKKKRFIQRAGMAITIVFGLAIVIS